MKLLVQNGAMFCRLKVCSYILAANDAGSLKAAPLRILKFPVVLPHKFLDAGRFNLRFSDTSEIIEIADKLRWISLSERTSPALRCGGLWQTSTRKHFTILIMKARRKRGLRYEGDKSKLFAYCITSVPSKCIIVAIIPVPASALPWSRGMPSVFTFFSILAGLKLSSSSL